MKRDRFLLALGVAALWPIESALGSPSSISVPPSPLGGTVDVDLDANGGQLQRLELRIDGILVASGTSSSLRYRWDTTLVPDGPHVLRSDATYRRGRSRTETVSVVVSNAAPAPDPEPTPDPDAPLYPSSSVYPSDTDPRA